MHPQSRKKYNVQTCQFSDRGNDENMSTRVHYIACMSRTGDACTCFFALFGYIQINSIISEFIMNSIATLKLNRSSEYPVSFFRATRGPRQNIRTTWKCIRHYHKCHCVFCVLIHWYETIFSLLFRGLVVCVRVAQQVWHVHVHQRRYLN